MAKLAANLSWLFLELPFLDRFKAAAEAGFRGVEFLFAYEFERAHLAEALRSCELDCVLMNAPAGQWATGERGLASLVGRETEFVDSVRSAIEYAKTLECPRIHVMAGIKSGSGMASHETLCSNLRYAGECAEASGITIVIEPINRGDMPGYALGSLDEALTILTEVAHPAVRLQFDVYHYLATMSRQTQRPDCGDPGLNTSRVLAAIATNLSIIEHIQIAGFPDRHEPYDSGTASFDVRQLLAGLDQLGYTGWIGCEYRPRLTTTAGLGWSSPFLG